MEHGLPGIKINKVKIQKYQKEIVSLVLLNQTMKIQATRMIQSQTTMMIKVEMTAMTMIAKTWAKKDFLGMNLNKKPKEKIEKESKENRKKRKIVIDSKRESD